MIVPILLKTPLKNENRRPIICNPIKNPALLMKGLIYGFIDVNKFNTYIISFKFLKPIVFCKGRNKYLN